MTSTESEHFKLPRRPKKLLHETDVSARLLRATELQTNSDDGRLREGRCEKETLDRGDRMQSGSGLGPTGCTGRWAASLAVAA